MSLARAFMYAGSKSLIMSLWPTSDQASQRIMKFFYEELASGKSKEDALRQAKIRYLNQADELSADPFLWSSFVLVGDERPLHGSRSIMWIGIPLTVITLLLGIYYIRRRYT